MGSKMKRLHSIDNEPKIKEAWAKLDEQVLDYVVNLLRTNAYVDHADEILNRGVDTIACMAVNDVFVMNAWGKSANADKLSMLADGNGEFAQAIGLPLDASAFGMGQRSQRFAFIAEDGVVTQLFVEGPGEFKVSSAEHVLSAL